MITEQCILLLKKDQLLSFVASQMYIENIVWHEISQTQNTDTTFYLSCGDTDLNLGWQLLVVGNGRAGVKKFWIKGTKIQIEGIGSSTLQHRMTDRVHSYIGYESTSCLRHPM